MKMPGFSAEVSLYKTNGHYQMTTRPGGGQAVIPQQLPCLPYAQAALEYGSVALQAAQEGYMEVAEIYAGVFKFFEHEMVACMILYSAMH